VKVNGLIWRRILMEDDDRNVGFPWALRIILLLVLLGFLYDDPSRIWRVMLLVVF
jgi:hypothetical protein|tara:strand:- start:226 stop:390 length:165 start_codon:yes stop_codon:yes gene_type:complete